MIDSALAREDAQAQILKVIAHPLRIRMLEVLSIDEECVCHLSALFDKPQPYISQHLASLKEAGLVSDRRVAQRVFYRSADPKVADLLRVSRALVGGSERVAERHAIVQGCTCPKCEVSGQ